MKKIAYLGKIQLSDTDLSFLNEAKEMADITYIMEVNPRFASGPAFMFKEISPRCGVYKAVELYPELSKYGALVDLDKFYIANTGGRLWQLKLLWTNLLLLFFLWRRHFDVIHVVWPPNLYEWFQYALCRKMILTVHDPFPHSSLDTFIVRLRRKAAFLFIKRFIILNKTQRDDFLKAYGLKAHNVFSSSLSTYDALRALNHDVQPEAGNYVLFVGKISAYKGVDYLLKTMPTVHEHCPQLRLVVAGGGQYHFDLSPYRNLDYIDIRNRFIPDAELVALILGARFLVCPYTDATQSGVVMSAFAFGKPVVATNVGALPEVVVDGQYGSIVEPRNSAALADAIIRLADSPDTLEAMHRNILQDYGKAGRKSWHYLAQEIVKHYQTL